MKINKRKYCILMATILAGAILGGCSQKPTGGNEEETSMKAEESAEVTESQEKGENKEKLKDEKAEAGSVMTRVAEGATITCWGWDVPEFNAKIEDYIKETAGITVQGQTMAQEDEISKITVAAATGTGLPDCFKLNNTDIPRLVEQGAVMDLTEMVEPYKELLPQVAWDMVTYNGKIWALPANSPAAGMFYRYDVMEKYGIDPDSLTTWDKWIEAGQKITKESGGEVSWICAPKNKLPNTIYWPVFQQYRAEILSADRKVTINSSNYRNGLALLQKIKDAEITTPIDEWSAPWYQSMKDGTVACYPNGTWFVQTLIQQAPETKGMWYFTPYPSIEEDGDRYPNFGNACCFISSQTENAEAAFEWCKAWSIDPEGSLDIALKELGVSVVSNVALENDYVNQPHEYFAKNQAYWKVATESFTKSTYFTPFLPESVEADTIWGRYFEKFWLGEMDADQALTEAEAELKTKLKME